MDHYRPHHVRAAKEPIVPVRCHCCRATGFAPCRICSGSGKVMAGASASGQPVFKCCDGCLGRKVTRCPQCHGQLFI